MHTAAELSRSDQTGSFVCRFWSSCQSGPVKLKLLENQCEAAMTAHQKKASVEWGKHRLKSRCAPIVWIIYLLTEIARAWVRKQRIDFFCVVSTEVLMHFFFFIFFPWLTTDGVTQGGDGGIHTLLFIDLLYENVFFFFLLFRLRLEHLQPTTPESWDLSSQTFFMIIRMLRLGAFEKKNDTAENK